MNTNASLAVIEDRISRLEHGVYDLNEPEQEKKCIETLINVQNRLQSAVTGREKITSVFSRLDDLEKFLSPDFRENATLNMSSKLNLVLMEEDRIRNAVASLQTVKDLTQYLDSEHIRAVPSLCPKLYELSQIQIKYKENEQELTEETKRLLSNYDSIITSLSKQFILWDTILTDIEKVKLKKKTVVA